MQSPSLRILSGTLVLTAMLNAADPAPDPLLAYQGRLVESGVVVNGPRAFTFAILDGSATELWNSGAQTITVTNGLYATLLGGAGMPVIPDTVLTRTGLLLRVTVDGRALSPDVPLVATLQVRSAWEAVAVTGAFAGDLTGTQSATVVSRLQGSAVDLSAAPQSGQALVYNGTAWTAATVPAGADGRTVRSGTGAPGVGVGVDGDFYLDTAASTLYGPKASGAWPAGVSLVGPVGATGAAGADGKTVRNGTVAPGTGVGVDGDFYLDTATNTLYGPKASGAWPAGVPLVADASVGTTKLADGAVTNAKLASMAARRSRAT
jgi:hypothetical protein